MYLSLNIKFLRIVICILLIIFFSLLIVNYMAISVPSNTSDMEFRVVIDAGHGSIDTGTSHGNIHEKNINLEIAKLLYRDLKEVNIIPIMTRSEDKLYLNSRNKDLRHRPIVAEQSGADVFVSIHTNNYPSSQPAGSQIFYKVNSDKSKEMAEFIQNELAKIRDRNKRVLKTGDYYVLNKINCPGVLIEVGFLSNSEDRRLLTDAAYQQKISKAIRDGLINYFQDNFNPQRKTVNMRKLENQIRVSSSNQNKLYYIGLTDNNMFLIKNNLSFPTGSFFEERYSNLNFTEMMAISALEQLLNPPDGLIAPLAKGTGINSLHIENNTAILDLTKEAVVNFQGGSDFEYLSIEALENTLLSIKGIDKVRILIDGKSGETLGGHIILD